MMARRATVLRTLAATAVLTALAGAGFAAGFENADLAHLQAKLANARYARLALPDRTVTVVRPSARPEGLAYETAFQPPRAAVFGGDAPDTLEPPASPIPWAAIQHMEAGEIRRVRNARIGAVVGGAAGIGVGWFLAYLTEMTGGREQNLVLITLGTGALFAVPGAALGAAFTGTTWREVRPTARAAPGRD